MDTIQSGKNRKIHLDFFVIVSNSDALPKTRMGESFPDPLSLGMQAAMCVSMSNVAFACHWMNIEFVSKECSITEFVNNRITSQSLNKKWQSLFQLLMDCQLRPTSQSFAVHIANFIVRNVKSFTNSRQLVRYYDMLRDPVVFWCQPVDASS